MIKGRHGCQEQGATRLEVALALLRRKLERLGDMGAQGVHTARISIVEELRHRAAKRQPDGRKPDRVYVRLHQIGVCQIEPRRHHLAGHHALRLAEKVLVVAAPDGAIGRDEGRLTTAPGAPATLGVIRRRRRHVAHMDDVQVGDIDAELHGRRAKQRLERPGAKVALAILAPLLLDLAGVLTASHINQLHGRFAVEAGEERVWPGAWVELQLHAARADGVTGDRAVARAPEQRVGTQLHCLAVLTSDAGQIARRAQGADQGRDEA